MTPGGVSGQNNAKRDVAFASRAVGIVSVCGARRQQQDSVSHVSYISCGKVDKQIEDAIKLIHGRFRSRLECVPVLTGVSYYPAERVQGEPAPRLELD